MLRFVRRLIIFGLAVYCIITGSVWTYGMLHRDPSPLPDVVAIVAISGPFDETRQRMDRANALFSNGAASQMILSGGTGAARDMKNMALAANVPASAIKLESESRSTLQNALFLREQDVLPADAPFLLVTHRYHLPRAWASFRWAGYRNITLIAADPANAPRFGKMFWLEGIKWPLNILRAAFGSTMMALDVPRDDWIGWLN